MIDWKIVASGWWFIWIVQWCTDLQTLNLKISIRFFLGYDPGSQDNRILSIIGIQEWYGLFWEVTSYM